MNKVAVVMGSKSDLPVVEKAINVLKDYHIQTEVRVLSAHRCPNEAREFAASAREGGFSVIIAAAGMAAIWRDYGSQYHAAGDRNPCSSAKLDGMDALLATSPRCPAASQWPRWPSTERRMPPCWRSRFWRCPTRSWPGSWTRPAPEKRLPFWKQMRNYRRGFNKK